MKKILFGLLLFLVPFIAQSQATNQGACGTVTTKKMMQRLIQNKLNASNINYQKSGVITWVPIKFHLVADNNGSGRIEQYKLFDQICNLNTDYADQDIQFYIEGDFNNINNTTIYSHTNQNGAGTQMQIRKVNNAINIFIGNSAGASSGGGVTLGYYSGFRDLIFAVKGSVGATNNTLTHELGHFFSLPHTFYGWEETDYHPNYDANNLPPASISYAGQTIPVELADGSNCTAAADLFCDTKPNYGLGLGWPNCNYNGGAVDPTGAAIDPDEDNYMSYFNLTTCINTFTAEQKAAIAADLNSGGRAFLRNNPATSTVEITSAPVQVEPTGNQTTVYYDNVRLIWNAVPDATRYFIQVSRFASFSNFAQGGTELLTGGTQTILTGLQAGRKYYWRVKAVNDISHCASYSATESFTTSSVTVNTTSIEGVNNISLRPNAISSNQSAQLLIDTERSIETTIRIFNVKGQIMNEENVSVQSGLTNHRLNTANLSAGLYIVSVQTESGIVNKKLIVTN